MHYDSRLEHPFASRLDTKIMDATINGKIDLR